MTTNEGENQMTIEWCPLPYGCTWRMYKVWGIGPDAYRASRLTDSTVIGDYESLDDAQKACEVDFQNIPASHPWKANQ